MTRRSRRCSSTTRNPAAVCPEHNEVVRGLLRPDLFTVVHEQFFTDTTDYADIVLPATTFFEHKDLQKAYGHYYLQVSNQAIAPLGECRPNVEVFRGAGATHGIRRGLLPRERGRDDRCGAGFGRSLARRDQSRAAGAGAGAAELCGFGSRLSASAAELRSARPGQDPAPAAVPHRRSRFFLLRAAASARLRGRRNFTARR